jgi:hypothetical protein
MSHFLCSLTWSVYGWAAQLIATIFVMHVKSNILSSSVGGIKLEKHSTWHYADTSQWSHQASETAFVISSIVIENCHSIFPQENLNLSFQSFLYHQEEMNIYKTRKRAQSECYFSQWIIQNEE